MSETPFEDVEAIDDPTDTIGPEFQQVEKEVQDDDSTEVVDPEFEDDSEEDPA
jgi:hypothetical protein